MGQLRILASTFAVGSAGGNQRSIESWARAVEGHDLTLVHRHFEPGPYRRFGSHVTLVPEWKVVPARPTRPQTWWRAAATRLGPRGPFDVYLRFSNSLDLAAGRSARLRALMPAGDHLGGAEADYDVVLSQSDGGIDLLDDPSKHRVCLPPTYPVAERCEPVDGLPATFVLSVFNAYSAVKGLDDLAACAAASHHPIVWAHRSGLTRDEDTPPGVHEVIDPTPGQLRTLYEGCEAYLSVSHSEGYGWSIADAVLLGRPVISRRVGIVASFPHDTEGIHEYDTIPEAIEQLRADTWSAPDPALVPSPGAARALLESLVADR